MTTLPSCFGKNWEAKHPECAGGLDPAYTNPKDGSHHRDRCKWYSQCATRTTANRTSSNFVPSNHLVRHRQPPPNPAHAAQAFVTGAMRGITRASQPHPASGKVQVKPGAQPAPTPPVQPYYGQPATAMVHPAMASNPWAVPMNYQTPGAQIPGYLTVPEPVVMGQHWTHRLGLSLVRAALKAGGHTIANFFDHQPMNPWHPPPQEPPPDHNT